MSKQADFSNDDSPRSDEVSQVIMALFTIRSIDEIYRLVKREQTLLLSDTVDQRMSNALEQARKEQDDDFAHGIEIFLDLLRNCREIGIEAAVGKAEMRLPDNTDSEEPTTLGDTLTTLDIELIDQRHCSRRDVLALLERKQAILLTDAADRVLTYYIVGIEIPGRTRTDPSPFEPCRTLLRRMRQVGIAQAWEEYIQMTEGKDWNSVRLFELFEEWIDVSTFDESDFGSVVSKKQKRDFFRAKREGYRFLVTHPELLDPGIDSVFEDQLAAIDWKADSDRLFADPSKLEQILNHKIATVLAPISRENNIVELLEGQMLLRDVHRRGGTMHIVQDAYVNAYGGFVLDLPQYLDDILQELDTLLLAEEPQQTAVERLSLLRDAFNRANGRVPIEIMVELGYEINRTSFEIPNIDPFSAQEAAIEQYTRSLTAYTRDRYPYQWALCQKKLGSLYAERITGNATDNQERAIQYYEAALQAVVRNVSNNKSMDETANNLTWAQIQDELSIVYSDRKAGDRIANLTSAIQYKEAILLVYNQKVFQGMIYHYMQFEIALLYMELADEAGQRGDISSGFTAYRHAHQAFLAARQNQNEVGWLNNRADLLRKWTALRNMYAFDAWCLWQLGEVRAAIVALEAGRAQTLAEAQTIGGVILAGVCETHCEQFIKVRNKWDEERIRGSASYFDVRGLFLAVRKAVRAHCQPNFLPGEPAYWEIMRAAPDQAVVYLSAMEDTGAAFVIPPGSGHPDPDRREPIAIELPLLTFRKVDDWFTRYDGKQQYAVGGYRFALQHRGIELLLSWVQSADNEQEQERRLSVPLAAVPPMVLTPFDTLHSAMSRVVNSWRVEADKLSGETDAVSQNRVRDLRAWLALPLREAFEKKEFVQPLNWSLQEVEVKYLQYDLGKTFVADLRRELDRLGLNDQNQPIALIPCGRLGMLPIHAAWVGLHEQTGEWVPFLETCELSFQASARSLSTARAALSKLPKNGPVVAVGDPQPTRAAKLDWAEAEARAIVALAKDHKRNGSRRFIGKDAKLDTIRTTLAEQRKERSGAWVHVASHAQAEPADPTKCFILLSDNERLTLAELQREQLLEGLRGFVASGCATALGDLERAPDELGSFAAGILQAGAPCAVATQWSVSDKATFLLMKRFMQELLQESTMSPARALREAAHWLRTAKQEELQDFVKIKLRDIATPDLDQASSRDAVRGVGVSVEETDSDLGETTRAQAEETLSIPEDTEKHGTHNDAPYWHAVYWASAIVYGV